MSRRGAARGKKVEMKGVMTRIALLGLAFALTAGAPAWAGPRARSHGHAHAYHGFGLGLGLGFGLSPYWGWGPYEYYPYYAAPYWGFPYWGTYDTSSEVRLQVKPKEARVLVDGAYVGIVDDFDGAFQRLRLPPGKHEITLKLQGYKTHRILLYAAIGNTVDVHYALVPGTGEDAPDAAATPADRSNETTSAAKARDEGQPGQVRMTIRPEDAVVYVDGEFHGVGQDAHSLLLPPGRHRIEVVRPGFQALEREIDVEPGGTVDLDIALKRS
jgi:hypothetical protein